MSQRSEPASTIAVSKYDQARDILRNKQFRPEDFAGNVTKIQEASGLDLQSLIDRLEETPFFAHGPRHVEMRRRMAGFFTPHAISKWTGKLDQIVDEVLIPLTKRNKIEMVDEVIEPIILKTRLSFFGIKQTDLESTRRWDDALVRFFMPLPSLRTFKRLQTTYDEVCAHAALEPSGDDAESPVSLRRHLDTPQAGLPPITEQSKHTLIAINVMATYAANGTLSNIIAAVLSLREGLAHAQDAEWLEANVDELIRLGGAPREILRSYEGDDISSDSGACPVSGKENARKLRRGDLVRISIEQCNKDASLFGDELGASSKKAADHLSFGSGIHICPGASLTRLLAMRVLAGLGRHLPSLKLSERDPPQQKADTPFLAFERITCFSGGSND